MGHRDAELLFLKNLIELFESLNYVMQNLYENEYLRL